MFLRSQSFSFRVELLSFRHENQFTSLGVFLKSFSIEFSTTSFRTFDKLIFVFESVFWLLDFLLLNDSLLIIFYGDDLFFDCIDWNFGRFYLLFYFWLGLLFWFFFLDENSSLNWSLHWSFYFCRFFLEQRGIVQDKLKLFICGLA